MLKVNWMKNSYIAKILSIITLTFVAIIFSFSQVYEGYRIDIFAYALLTGLVTVFTIFFILNIKKIFSVIDGVQNIWIIFAILLLTTILCFLNANSYVQNFAFMVISFDFLLLTLISYLKIHHTSKRCKKQF